MYNRRIQCYIAALLLLLLLFNLSACFRLATLPEARFACSMSTCHRYTALEFDAGESSGGGVGGLISYSWTFGDGSTGSGETVTHCYTSPGEYVATLTVEGSNGEAASRSEVITVLDGIVVPQMYPTIQQAIDAAQDGQTVIVMPGTYEVALTIKAKRITLQSTNPESAETVGQTILEPVDFAGRPIINVGEGSAGVIAGFTLQNSTTCPACPGGAIFVSESSPTIKNNVFRNNFDGTIVAYEAGCKIVSNVFEDNVGTPRGTPGGAIHARNCNRSLVIAGNTFSNNTAKTGGAIYISSSCNDVTPGISAAHLISNNDFQGNTATEFGGGAIFVEYGASLNWEDVESVNRFNSNSPST